jgi:thymidylate kinase
MTLQRYLLRLSMDKETFTSNFLTKFFDSLNNEKITYCILRNYERLPEEVGNDIDIWVKNGEQKRFQKILFETAENCGWNIIRYSPRLSYCGEGDYFLIKNSQSYSIIHIDLWTFIYWRGITYVDEEIFPKYLVFHKKGFYIPSPGIEASISLLKNLLYYGKVQEKYKNKIIEYSTKDSEGFLEATRKPFGEKVAEFILSAAKTGKWEELEKKYNFICLALFKRVLFQKLLLQLKHWIIYSYGQLKKFAFSRDGIFLVLIGPDGSGKSTIAKKLMESEVKRFFQKKMYFHGHFHFLPELKKILTFFKKGKKEFVENPNKSLEPFGTFRSMFYPLYYGVNYFLGHLLIWKERVKGGLIIFDRYFYDYLIQKQFINCPRWFLYFISKVIPMPDAIIYLRNNPEIIHKRKQELPIEEIERQSKFCSEIVRCFSNGFVVETSLTPDEVVANIGWIIIEKIKEKQGTHKS